VVFFVIAGSYGQSLGDVAREQRQKQAKDAHTERKVLTNEDLPARGPSRNQPPPLALTNTRLRPQRLLRTTFTPPSSGRRRLKRKGIRSRHCSRKSTN
jgi:hypothetical protein